MDRHASTTTKCTLKLPREIESLFVSESIRVLLVDIGFKRIFPRCELQCRCLTVFSSVCMRLCLPVSVCLFVSVSRSLSLYLSLSLCLCLSPSLFSLLNAVKNKKGCRLARGKLWMDQAEQSIQHVSCLTELKQVRDWEKLTVEFYETVARDPRHALPRMARWKSQCRSGCHMTS